MPVAYHDRMYILASFVPDWLEFIVGFRDNRWVWAARSLNPGRLGVCASHGYDTAEEAMVACEEWRARRDWDALP
jgi:hypothetical protein